MFFCSACFNKVSSFLLIHLNMVFCICCSKVMPSVCDGCSQWFLNITEHRSSCMYTRQTDLKKIIFNKKKTVDYELILFVCFFKTYLKDACNVT